MKEYIAHYNTIQCRMWQKGRRPTMTRLNLKCNQIL